MKRSTFRKALLITWILFLIFILFVSPKAKEEEQKEDILKDIKDYPYIVEKHCKGDCLGIHLKLIPNKEIYTYEEILKIPNREVFTYDEDFSYQLILTNPSNHIFKNIVKVISEPSSLLEPYKEGQDFKIELSPGEEKIIPFEEEIKRGNRQAYSFQDTGIKKIMVISRKENPIIFISLKDPEKIMTNIAYFNFEVISKWEKMDRESTKYLTEETKNLNEKIYKLTIIIVALTAFLILLQFLKEEIY